jgi:hypothetical protein
MWEKAMQTNRNIAYRLAYETATLELDLLQGVMRKLQQEKDRIENAIASRRPLSTVESAG